jgi:tetratricopeptide (TPR) repeat protein
MGAVRRSRGIFCAAALLLASAIAALPATAFGGEEGQPKWAGQVPRQAKERDAWESLVGALVREDMPFGAMAAATRMLVFLQDVDSKELAFRTIIGVMDRGYPFNSRPLFVVGDLDLRTNTSFSNSYNLNKGLINLDLGMTRWAEDYFHRIGRPDFAKYLFYQAIEAYSRRDFGKAQELLGKILRQSASPDQASLAAKAARTMARIHYEKGEYKEALAVYDEFLLRLNPLTSSDWLEAAWCLFNLGEHSKALGYLYNLESPLVEDHLMLEKYVLRALIYRELCATTETEQLVNSFNRDFGDVVRGIKTGAPLRSFRALRLLEIPENQDYLRAIRTRLALEGELRRLTVLPSRLRDLATYLYSSEIDALGQTALMAEEEALRASAEKLVLLAENLRFLRFDVAREKYNPERVFAAQELVPAKSRPDDAYEVILSWPQRNDFWRDERMNYRGEIKKKCGE